MPIVVCLDDPQRLLARVAGRVREGGHAVPAERILARYPRTLANLAKAVRLVGVAILYDSELVKLGTQQAVAICRHGLTEQKITPLPGWARKVLTV